MASKRSKKSPSATKIYLKGRPSERQKLFFESRTRYTAYGGARGGGKSWALRRKLILMALHYDGIRILIIRRTLSELRENHILPMLAELSDVAPYSESKHVFDFPNGSRISLGYMDNERDVLRYQGQEYDVIAIDEATQLTEYQFSTLKACLRGPNSHPKRMYLTCNPGGVGHAWVKRLFIDRCFRSNEDPADYSFIPAKVYDNHVLVNSDPDYVRGLESLPDALKQAWLCGNWDIFEGQFFSEFSRDKHVIAPFDTKHCARHWAAMDYGFDMLAVVWLASDTSGNIFVERELAVSGLTLSKAAELTAAQCNKSTEFIVASPDLWNRRQDSGLSGVEIMSSVKDLPPLIKADNRRVIGWRYLRELLSSSGNDYSSKLSIFQNATELIRCLPALLHDRRNPEDASGEPHSVTHLPEALRYGVMAFLPENEKPESIRSLADEFFSRKKETLAEALLRF